ncbi:hypothetical protein TNCV_1549401 [Trichonephila clavipes]|nr:hypothetical protein TNCV_1549401 [Trichonephila clavipes]
MSLVAHVMGAAIADIHHPGTVRWFGKTQRPIDAVSGQRLMRQLALRVCNVRSSRRLVCRERFELDRSVNEVSSVH